MENEELSAMEKLLDRLYTLRCMVKSQDYGEYTEDLVAFIERNEMDCHRKLRELEKGINLMLDAQAERHEYDRLQEAKNGV